MSSAAGALLGKSTQDPRATGPKPPEEQRHQAKHMMPPTVTDRVIGFHRFSIPSLGKDFCLQLSWALQTGDRFTASLWSYCLFAKERVRLSGLILRLGELV